MLVFHMADVDSCDASYVFSRLSFCSPSIRMSRAVQIFHELLESYKVRTEQLDSVSSTLTTPPPAQSRGVLLYITHLRPGIREVFENAGIVKLLGPDVFYDTLGDAIAHIETRGG